MVVVTLKDGTQYMMDTDDESMAIMDVERKLRQRLDCREISNAMFIPAKLNNNSNEYNPIDAYKTNHVPLNASKGWSYKWGDKGTSFR